MMNSCTRSGVPLIADTYIPAIVSSALLPEIRASAVNIANASPNINEINVKGMV